MPDATDGIEHATDGPFCLGERICVDCCLCDECGRTVGTRHLDTCACPPDGQHWYCRDCNAKRVAGILAGPTPSVRRLSGQE